MQNQNSSPIHIKHWPTEIPLLILVALLSFVIWLALIVTVFGILYALILGVLFFVVHAAFVAHVRGNTVRITAEQLPELHAAITNLANKFEFKKVPEAYLLQGGGVLNALATKFLRSKMLIIYSKLLEACDDNTAARDMILAHELGHIKAGHLRWHWFLIPGMLVPFVGKALSRAREYTCDRYGLAGAGDMQGALLGLTILAAGKKYASQVSREAMVKQINSLNTGWMKIGEWSSTHPMLAKRMYALDPTLHQIETKSFRGILSALCIIVIMIAFFVGIVMGFALLPSYVHKFLPHHMENRIENSMAPAVAPADSSGSGVETIH